MNTIISMLVLTRNQAHRENTLNRRATSSLHTAIRTSGSRSAPSPARTSITSYNTNMAPLTQLTSTEINALREPYELHDQLTSHQQLHHNHLKALASPFSHHHHAPKCSHPLTSSPPTDDHSKTLLLNSQRVHEVDRHGTHQTGAITSREARAPESRCSSRAKRAREQPPGEPVDIACTSPVMDTSDESASMLWSASGNPNDQQQTELPPRAPRSLHLPGAEQKQRCRRTQHPVAAPSAHCAALANDCCVLDVDQHMAAPAAPRSAPSASPVESSPAAASCCNINFGYLMEMLATESPGLNADQQWPHETTGAQQDDMYYVSSNDIYYDKLCTSPTSRLHTPFPTATSTSVRKPEWCSRMVGTPTWDNARALFL